MTLFEGPLSIISVPDWKYGARAYPAVVVYGGLYNMEGSWFLGLDKKQRSTLSSTRKLIKPKLSPETLMIPADLLEKTVFVLPKSYASSTTNTCENCLKELDVPLKSPLPGVESITSYSLCGFSRGGVEVYRYRSTREWKILGLIDPSAPTMGGFKDTVLDESASKIRCIYWVPNWGTGGYSGKIPGFAKHLRQLLNGSNRGHLIEKEVSHAKMPLTFFTEFGEDFF